MSSLRISWRLALIALIAVVGCIAIGGSMLFTIKNSLVEDRKEQVRNLVETAHAIIEHYAALEESGSMSRAAAQDAAKAALKSLHYGAGGYFWVNDLYPRMVVHPSKPEGCDLSTFKDAANTPIFLVMVDIVRQHGSGFIT